MAGFNLLIFYLKDIETGLLSEFDLCVSFPFFVCLSLMYSFQNLTLVSGYDDLNKTAETAELVLKPLA